MTKSGGYIRDPTSPGSSASLPAKTAVKELSMSPEELLIDICYYFEKSSKGGEDLKQFQEFCNVAQQRNQVVQKEAQFDVTYNDTVTSKSQTIYAFNHTVSRNKTGAIRVSVELLSEGPVQSNGSNDSPILFVVRQKQAVLSFQVPLIFHGPSWRKYQYTEAARTLCQPPTQVPSETQFFYVDASTLSNAGISYQLRVSRVDSFTLQTNKKFSFSATPSQPQFFKYVFPEGVDTVIVKVNSSVNFPCSVMSIQDVQCPVYDLDNNVAFIGMYQTMTTTAAITVQKKDFPSNSFYVVVVVKMEDEACGGPLKLYPLVPDQLFDPGNHSKSLEVVVSPAIDCELDSYAMGMWTCLGIFLFVPICCGFACVIYICVKKKEGPMKPGETSPAETGHSLEPVGSSREESLSAAEEDKNSMCTKESYGASCPKYLYVSDLAKRDQRSLTKRYMIYFLNTVIIAVFYALPVIQLVITYQTVFNRTGNQDICYYNFLCAHPLGPLSSFNNILSNLGYVMLGLLFLVIVLTRDIMHMRNNSNALECGIPKHFGLFYAMGTALMMEGVLSACYHVCPNHTNYQFDTTFMYMIAGLCMLKLYQKRHPDITFSAYTAYVWPIAVIILSVLGVVFGRGNTAFWIVFSVLYILATILISIQIYNLSCWNLDSGILSRMRCEHGQCSRPIYMDRVLLLVFGNIINFILVVIGLVKKPSDFASYLLVIAICNLLLYFAFYIIMKLRSGERIQCLAWVCILFTTVFWVSALVFFFQGLSNWEKTPAESREHNRECILLSFFDDHDIWHFLSSIAMFGSFLVLLTMDDDLDSVQRNKIIVF
ncbi:SID1 transmembrane family member 2-like [Chanos chanos]|uniref:SID1 transmembrane family member 2-like n=1 Tax=Chanos chanos TaxID=29144 RepID=A0A6J2VKZ3_CHACN|nr:SID1 transmembrane family member 2-like [Chanos chanos]